MDNGAILYTAYLNGDESALEQLVKLYYDGLVRFAYCFVKSAAVAEDVVADAYATLIVKRKRFFPRASFKNVLVQNGTQQMHRLFASSQTLCAVGRLAKRA